MAGFLSAREQPSPSSHKDPTFLNGLPPFKLSFFIDISLTPASNDKSLHEIVELLLLNIFIVFSSSSECVARFCFEISPKVLVVGVCSDPISFH
jgi:hypothetical protein